MSENVEKFLKGLKRHDKYLVDYGTRIHDMYPLGKMDQTIYENITVPISLPVAMMLFGLATTLLVEQAAAAAMPPEVPPT